MEEISPADVCACFCLFLPLPVCGSIGRKQQDKGGVEDAFFFPCPFYKVHLLDSLLTLTLMLCFISMLITGFQARRLSHGGLVHQGEGPYAD